jgi:membrane protein YdbS with pleckstrin-like domain
VGPARNLLHEDEELLAEARPHPIVVVGPVLLLLLALAAAVTVAIRYPHAPVAVAWVLAAMVALPALWVLARLLRWRSVRFLVTTSRLLYRRGIIGRDVVQLRFQRVVEVHLIQSVGGRLIGCGRLVFEVAGGERPLVVEDVRRPRRLQQVITAQLDRFDLPYGPYGGPRGYGPYAGPSGYGPWPTASGSPTAPTPVTSRAGAPRQAAGRAGRRSGPAGRWQASTDTPPHGVVLGDDDATIPGQILQLDELRRRGILSEEEFAAKKAELLSRL